MEADIEVPDLLGRAAHRTLEQMADAPLQHQTSGASPARCSIPESRATPIVLIRLLESAPLVTNSSRHPGKYGFIYEAMDAIAFKTGGACEKARS